jgi:hypothetical protein
MRKFSNNIIKFKNFDSKNTNLKIKAIKIFQSLSLFNGILLYHRKILTDFKEENMKKL